MFQGRTLFNKNKHAEKATGSDSTCKACGGDLYVNRG